MAEKILKKNKAKVCLFGHTHEWQLEKLKDGIYVNTGAWVEEAGKPIFVEIDDKKIRVLNAKNFKPLQEIEY